MSQPAGKEEHYWAYGVSDFYLFQDKLGNGIAKNEEINNCESK